MKLKYNELIFDVNGDVNLDNYYTKSECDNKYALKSHTHSQYATTTAVTNAQNTANNALNVANSKSTLNKSHGMVTLPQTNSPSLTLTDTALIVGFCPGNPGDTKTGIVYIDGVNIRLTYINYDSSGNGKTVYCIGGIGLKNNVITYNKSLNNAWDNTREIGTYI